MSSQVIIMITKQITNQDNGLFVPIFKAKCWPHLRRCVAKFGRFVMSNALKICDCRTSLSNSICYITQTVDWSLNIGWASRHQGIPMCLVASRNIWFGDSIIPLRLTAASTFCTQKLFAFAEYCNNVMGPPESYSICGINDHKLCLNSSSGLW